MCAEFNVCGDLFGVNMSPDEENSAIRMYPVRSKDKFLVFGAPSIDDEEVNAVVETMRGGWLGTGPRVAEFESAIARYKMCHHAVALNSCTAALHLSLLSAGVGPGDEVITTPLTFCATINSIIHTGATPVLVDVDRKSMNINPDLIAKAITPRTKAVLPVHFAGRSCEMDSIVSICNENQLLLIEDCAHAIETTYHGRAVGTFGDYGCMSFYVTKNLATGEGGMVLVRDAEAASRIKVLALHGMNYDAWKRFSDEGYKHYDVVTAGFKYNMMDIQAAIGLQQLAKLESFWLRRLQIWQRYNEAFENLPVTLPAVSAPNTRHGLHLYTILIDPEQTNGITRDEFMIRMAQQNIGIGVHYRSVVDHEYYRRQFGWRPEDTPHATQIGRQTVSIPLSAKLTDGDVDDVICAVQRCLKSGRS
jgi:dTDP-4-amino-4,6-dideoxygalactose transaminase